MKRNAVKQPLGQLLWDHTGHGKSPALLCDQVLDVGQHSMTRSVSTGTLSIKEEGVLRFILPMWKKAGNMKIDADQ